MAVTEQQVQDALKTLVDPNTRKDYVSSRSVRNIKVDGGKVGVDFGARGETEDVVATVKAYPSSCPALCRASTPYFLFKA